jgi:hydrogenase nickel incorporation protein HypB
MSGIKLIDIKQAVLSENRDLAEQIRTDLEERGVGLVNLMSAPGSGKTSLILRTLAGLRDDYRMAVIEGDIDSAVDAERVAAEGVAAVQIRTGGSCHLSAAMVQKGLEAVPLEELDLLFLENIGNLICPAECDTGATLNVAMVSVPEGDDKPLKYPLVFRVADVVVVNKVDVLDRFDFDADVFRRRVRRLTGAPIFLVSCATGEGIGPWCHWLRQILSPSSLRPISPATPNGP